MMSTDTFIALRHSMTYAMIRAFRFYRWQIKHLARRFDARGRCAD